MSVKARRRRFLTTTYATTNRTIEPKTPPTISPALFAGDEEANDLSIEKTKKTKKQNKTKRKKKEKKIDFI